jgi:hypothetical protein
MSVKNMTAEQKKDIFLALVAAQDAQTMSVANSKRQVMVEFGVTLAQLEEITEEGMDKGWLDEVVAH